MDSDTEQRPGVDAKSAARLLLQERYRQVADGEGDQLRQDADLRVMVRICDREGWIDAANAIENLAAIVGRESDARRRLDQAHADLRIATGQRESLERFIAREHELSGS